MKRDRVKTARNRASIHQDLEARGYASRFRSANPLGGSHLRRVLLGMVDKYLGDDVLPPDARRRRDPRSYGYRDRRGTIREPIMSYWTFVNFSKSYKSNEGVRATLRRCGLAHMAF